MDGPAADVFVVDMAKAEHYAQAITTGGAEVFGRPIVNDQTDIETMLDTAGENGEVAVVIDMTASGAQLLLTVAAERGMPVAYVTGLQMRRVSELYASTAKTDPRDAWVLADFARRNADRLTWLEVRDELLVRLRVLNGRDTDLATDSNRTINRCRDALVAISPALERAVGHRLGQPGVREALKRWSTPRHCGQRAEPRSGTSSISGPRVWVRRSAKRSSRRSMPTLSRCQRRKPGVR